MKTKSNLSVAKITLAAMAVVLAVSAHAAYVDFTNSQAVGSVNLNDLTNAVNWSDGLYPTSDKEYRVHGNRYAGMGDGLSFPGKKLTIGQKGGSNGYLVIKGDGSTIGFQNDGLFLERGQLYFNQGWQTHSITGNITVTAPTSVPFSIYGSWQWKIACNIKGSVSSADSCALTVYNQYKLANDGSRNDPLYEITFSGDMTGFNGLLNLGGDNANYAYSTVYMINRSLPGMIKVTEPGRLYLSKTASDFGLLTVGSLELTDKSTIRLGLSDSAASSVTVTNSLTAPYSGRAFVELQRFGNDGYTSTGARHTLFTLPVGTDADAVRAKLLFKACPTLSSAQTNFLGTASIVDGTDGLGRPTLSLVAPAATRMTSSDSTWGKSSFEAECGDHWEGGSVGTLPDTNLMFTVSAGMKLRTPRNNKTSVFPGRTLVLRYLAQLSMNGNARVDDLRLAPTAIIDNMATDTEYTLYGSVLTGVLDDPDAGLAYVRSAGDSRLHIASKISGHSDLQFIGAKNGDVQTSQANFFVEGDNSGFDGRICVTNVLNPGTARSRLFASSAANLGGAMRQFTADGIKLSVGSELVPTATFALNEPTRGLYIDGSGVINVTNAANVFTVGTTITYAGTLEKKGRGTLKLVSAPSVVGGTSPTLNVTEGRVAVSSAEAFKGLDVNVAEGAGLTVPCGGDGIDLTKAESFTGSGGALDVKIDMVGVDAAAGDLEVPLLTVASGDAVTYLSALHVSLANAPRGFRVKELTTVSAGDGVTLQAKVGRVGFVMVVK